MATTTVRGDGARRQPGPGGTAWTAPDRRGSRDRAGPAGDDERIMTSLLPAPRRIQAPRGDRADAAHRRPLVLLAALAGVGAACSTLVVCLAGGVIGWFLTDA